MKLKKLNDVQKLVSLSLSFTLALLIMRGLYTGMLTYFFYPWNLFLAILPVYFSGLLLKEKTFNYKSILWLGLWLLFLPNAPYLLTDIFHFKERPPVPMWFDLMLVVSCAWNGILFCMISLFRVERFLKTRVNSGFVNVLMFLLLIPCGYGIYIGRYLRYNSWDVVTNPARLIKTSTHHIHHPFESLNVWMFTFVFATFLGIIYFTTKQLPRLLYTKRQL
jgi:uncharacterized membrane protein